LAPYLAGPASATASEMRDLFMCFALLLFAHLQANAETPHRDLVKVLELAARSTVTHMTEASEKSFLFFSSFFFVANDACNMCHGVPSARFHACLSPLF
jgi:hypothetical protein